eukprot:TRINITY_DN27217_c0_g1_i1.p1 TRINITY_DN27217_c0_g1~~TRINITY_DN27217_c0_g1_i1.p1  ORF type:complete len:193 (+),score=66.30 TRINITY_DN27217_c0_g1_i1:427-1005(+)
MYKGKGMARALGFPEQAGWARDTSSHNYEDLCEEVRLGVYNSELCGTMSLIDEQCSAGNIVTLAGMRLSGEWGAATCRLLKSAVLYCQKEGVLFSAGKPSVQVAAALLLLFQHDESKAFWTYLYMSCTVLAMYWHDGQLGLAADQAVINELMGELGPDLEEHLGSLGITPGELVAQHLSLSLIHISEPTRPY